MRIQPAYLKHALTHEVAYGSLLQDRRRALHARLAGAIQSLYADRLPEQVERLAHHALRGEVWDVAAVALRQAGMKAAERSANHEAVLFFEQALIALSHLPRSRETVEQAIDVRFELRHSLLLLAEFDRIRDHLRVAEDLATSLGDERRLGRIHAFLSNYHNNAGEPEQAIAHARRALEVAEALDDFGLEILSRFYLGRVTREVGEFRQACEHLRKNLARLDGAPAFTAFGAAAAPFVLSSCNLILAFAELGEFAEGLELGRQLAGRVDPSAHAHTQMLVCQGLAPFHILKGDFDEARRTNERGLLLCQMHGLTAYAGWFLSCLGYGDALAGRPSESIPRLAEGVAQMTQIRQHMWLPAALAHLAEAQLLAGHADASEVAARALQRARGQRARGDEAWVLRLLGEIASHHDHPDVATAEAHYGSAMTLAFELGMRPLVAHCHLGLGKPCRRTGDQAKAKEHLVTATTMYREMDMTFWREQAEAVIADVG